MGFFERNRRALVDKGYDPARLPPGQYHTERFPVLHVGDVPTYDMAAWTFVISGAVTRERVLTWTELRALPEAEIVTDIHCVTKWSKFDTRWKGVRFRDVMTLVGRKDKSDTLSRVGSLLPESTLGGNERHERV